MLRIRLSRVGKKKQPSYRIVVADSRAPRDGAHIKIIGHYNPLTTPPTLVVKEEDAIHWLQKGAKPSDTAAKLMTRLGIMEKAGVEPVVYKGPDVPPGKRPKKGEEAAPAAPASPAATAETQAEEAPAEEAPAETTEPETEEPKEEPAPEPEASSEEPQEA